MLSKPGMNREESKAVTAFVQEWPIVEMDPAIMEAAIRLRKKHRLKLPDAIIAATAMTMDVPLLTADRVFERVKGEITVLLYEV
ncbi:MAG TPA: PIN domain-containing protein [Flavobacteriales bacterium]|nr:PIN domain-containing protein [Flavobacteriales bacterium]